MLAPCPFQEILRAKRRAQDDVARGMVKGVEKSALSCRATTPHGPILTRPPHKHTNLVKDVEPCLPYPLIHFFLKIF
ncbi:hypothetical protein Lsha_0262 [Legionella shakespearei DSM 23087]|uniref:Uncharacterized protein n=1 Tax=Legionella shakespearei DSM 23087 TaxID=1122169 RepID=A0A0W0Z8K2_9GAMM|nr:hypothetical protein Lsha_0262 [Legionella shakespearei DSM 23087]